MKTVQEVKPLRLLLSLSLLLLGLGLLTHAAHAFDYPEPGDYARGAKAWAENCARCHNMRSTNELRDDQWITTVFHMRVRAGLTGQETRDILTFLQGSNASPPPAAKPSSVSLAGTGKDPKGQSGKAVYGKTCVACHGDNGKGTLPGVPDFTEKNGPLAKSDNVIFNNILNGYQSPGSMMAMPAKGGDGTLTHADIDSVLRYIREVFGQ